MPNIDLFSSRLNKQTDTFVTWFPEPGSFHSNAFTMYWHDYKPYMDRVKRIWYLSPMRAAKVQAPLNGWACTVKVCHDGMLEDTNSLDGAHIFPPFSLVGKVVNKTVKDQVEKDILVFPLWKSQTWFPLLIDIICSFPVRLPRHKDLLVLPHNGDYHSLCQTMRLVTVTVSGRHSVVEEFQKILL